MPQSCRFSGTYASSSPSAMSASLFRIRIPSVGSACFWAGSGSVIYFFACCWKDPASNPDPSINNQENEKTLISTVLWLDFFSLKNDVNVGYMYLQKGISIKIILSGSASASGSVSHKYGSASGSVPKCHGSRPLDLASYVFQINVSFGCACTSGYNCEGWPLCFYQIPGGGKKNIFKGKLVHERV